MLLGFRYSMIQLLLSSRYDVLDEVLEIQRRKIGEAPTLTGSALYCRETDRQTEKKNLQLSNSDACRGQKRKLWWEVSYVKEGRKGPPDKD